LFVLIFQSYVGNSHNFGLATPLRAHAFISPCRKSECLIYSHLISLGFYAPSCETICHFLSLSYVN